MWHVCICVYIHMCIYVHMYIHIAIRSIPIWEHGTGTHHKTNGDPVQQCIEQTPYQTEKRPNEKTSVISEHRNCELPLHSPTLSLADCTSGRILIYPSSSQSCCVYIYEKICLGFWGGGLLGLFLPCDLISFPWNSCVLREGTRPVHYRPSPANMQGSLSLYFSLSSPSSQACLSAPLSPPHPLWVFSESPWSWSSLFLLRVPNAWWCRCWLSRVWPPCFSDRWPCVEMRQNGIWSDLS